jgi:molecular chaperone DnaK (HSP70)
MASEAKSVESVQLTALIKALKHDLRSYHQEMEDSDEPALFSIEGATVEAEVMASKNKSKEGGLDLKVIRLGGGSATTSGVVFRLSLSLRLLPDADEKYAGLGTDEETQK